MLIAQRKKSKKQIWQASEKYGKKIWKPDRKTGAKNAGQKKLPCFS